MAFPTFTMRQLLEAGVHFGHTTRRWNPKMAPYIFGVRNGVHIIDLEQTVPLLHQALVTVREVAAGGGRVLFVGTKRQASEIIRDTAKRCGQYYVDHRWLGGMLTNWKTISHSIKRLRELDTQLSDETSEEVTGLTKKELLNLTRERDKLERALGGIKDMGDLPDVLVVIDTNKEHIAVAEATKLSIPVVAVLDSNSDPLGVTHPVPGNDDAIRAISTYCNLIADAVLDGIQQELMTSGGDVGEAEEAPAETLPEAAAAAEAPPAETPPAETPAAKAPTGETPAGEVAEAETPAPEAAAETSETSEPAAAPAEEAKAAEPEKTEAEAPAAEPGEAEAEETAKTAEKPAADGEAEDPAAALVAEPAETTQKQAS